MTAVMKTDNKEYSNTVGVKWDSGFHWTSQTLVKLKRLITLSDVTIGAFSIDDKFQCFTLEDPPHDPKIMGKTRIPAGIYALAPRYHGRKYMQYKQRFPKLPEGVIEIMDIPNFTDVLIHIGNYPKDTAGCVLVGQGIRKRRGTLMLTDSTAAYRELFPKLYDYVTHTLFPSIVIED